MENKLLTPIFEEKEERNWYYYKANGKKFEGDGGPFNLIDILEVFKNWSEG